MALPNFLANLQNIPGSSANANTFLAQISARIFAISPSDYQIFLANLATSPYIFSRIESDIASGVLNSSVDFSLGAGAQFNSAGLYTDGPNIGQPIVLNGNSVTKVMQVSGAFLRTYGGDYFRLLITIDHEIAHAEYTQTYNAAYSNALSNINASTILNSQSATDYIFNGVRTETINESYAVIRSWNDFLNAYKVAHPGSYTSSGTISGSSALLQQAIEKFTQGNLFSTGDNSETIISTLFQADGSIGLPLNADGTINFSGIASDAEAQALADRIMITDGSVAGQHYGVTMALDFIKKEFELQQSSGSNGKIPIDFSKFGFVDQATGDAWSAGDVIKQLAKAHLFDNNYNNAVFQVNSYETVIVKQTTVGDIVTTKIYIYDPRSTIPDPNSISTNDVPAGVLTYNKVTKKNVDYTGVFQVSISSVFKEDILKEKTDLSESGHTYGTVGSIIGSVLGNFFANGNAVEGVVYSSLLGQLGKGLFLAMDGVSDDLIKFMDGTNVNVMDNFAGGLGAGLLSGGAGLISSTLSLDLANQLGIKGFGAELISVVVSSETSAVVTQVLNNLHNGLTAFYAGFDGQAIRNAAGEIITLRDGTTQLPTTSLSSVALSSVASFFGTKLASLIVQPKTEAGAILGSIFSAVDSYLYAMQFGAQFGATFGPVGAFVGAFAGYIWGTLIGNLFGRKKPRIPSASAETILQIPYAEYKIGNIASANGGSTDTVVAMASAAAETLNAIILQVTGNGHSAHYVSNSVPPSVAFGYNGGVLYYKLGGGTAVNVNSANDAVDAGVLWAVPQTKIIGGDIFVKRALYVTATDIVNLVNNIQTAQDYGNYASNKETINSYIQAAYGTLTQAEQDFYTSNKTLVNIIDMNGASTLTSAQYSVYAENRSVIDNIVSALKGQLVANPWIITLERANELNLNDWTKSDFYGGLQGFLQSFDVGVGNGQAHYEDINFELNSGNVTLSAASQSKSGLFTVLAQSSGNHSSVTINNFGPTMGYTVASMGMMTTTDTLEFAGGSTQSVTLNNIGHSGYNIFIGGNGGNTIRAGLNDTWIRGGGGTDLFYGGNGHDVIIAGNGNTTIFGGNSDSYLAAGGGNDSITGGSGNDTIVLGGGHATINGGAGDDFIVLSGLAAGNGSIDGGSGSNTLSFERYASGVNVNLGTWTSPSGTSYTLTNIQNLIGSVSGGNTLRTTALDATMEGGAGSDTFIGVAGGNSTVTFANSGAGVYVDLSTGISFGGSSTGDIFSNIKNVTGSGFDDELKGVAGSTLDGGTGGNDWFDYSGGGNTYKGSVEGTGTVDYSMAATSVSVDLTNEATTGGHATVGGATDTLFNITHIIGSTHGTTLTGAVTTTITYNSNGTINSSGTYNPIEFTATGGTNTLYLGGNDVVDIGIGAGITNVSGGSLNNIMVNETLRFGSGMTYDNLWSSMSASVQGNIYGVGSVPPEWQSTNKWSFGIRGTGDVANYTVDRKGYDQSIPIISSTLTYLDMNGASKLDLSGIHTVTGELSYSGGSYYDTNGMWTEYYTGSDTITATVAGTQTGGMLIITGGAATVINVDGGGVTSNGSVIIAGQAGAGGITINASAGDDQITYERGDGHYTIIGTGGQKTIDFGPSVAASDVIYRVIGNDLYIGVQDLTNPDLTADQVSDSIKLVSGAIHTTNSDGTLTFTHPFFIQVGGTTIDLSKLTTVDWTGADVSVSEISTQNGSVSVSNMTVNVNSGLTGTVTGSGDTINAGTGSHITIAGNANVINTTSGSVTLSGINSALGVNGNSNTVTMSGAGDVLTVTGSGNSVTGNSDTIIAKTDNAALTVSGSGNTVYVRAKGMTITSGASTVVFDTANDGGAVIGTGSTIIAGAAGQSIGVSGSGNSVYMRGAGDTLMANNTSIILDNSGVTETITGNGNALNITAYSDVINVDGNNNTVTGHWATINLTKTGTANSVSGIGLTVNAVDGATVSMTCNPTSGDQVSTLHLSNGVMHLLANSHVDLYGAGNSTTAAGGDIFGIWGNNNTFSGTGSNSISSNGDNLTLTMSNSSLTDSGNGVSATVNGDNNTVHANGSAEHFSVNGTNNLIEGNGATVALAGTSRTLLVHGNNNIVTAGNLSNIDIDGSATVTASGSTISTSGWNGGTANVSITGNNDIINLDGFGDTVAIHGSNETISGHWTTVNLTQANATIAVNGIGLTLNAASGDAITISSVIASGDQIDTVNLSNGTVNVLSGSTVRVTGNNDTVTVQSGAYAYITSANTGTIVTSNGGGVDIEGTVTANVSNSTINSGNSNLTFSVNGSGNTVKLNGSGDNVTIHGDNNTINGGLVLNLTGSGNIINDSGGTFNLSQANATLTVNGSNDTITASGANSTVTVTGDADTVTAGAGSVIHGATLSGPQGGQITATVTNGTLTMANNGRLSIYGDGNTATLGTNTNLYLHGNSETVTQGNGTATLWGTNEAVTIGSGSTVWIYGDHAQVNTSGSTLTSSVSDGTARLTGDNNTLTVQAGRNTLNLAGGGNIINMSWGTLNLTSANKAVTVNGIGMIVNAASGDTVTMSGTVTSGDQIGDLYLSNGTATIKSGSNVRIHGSNDAVTIESGAYVHFTSEDTGITVTSNGGGMQVEGAITANVTNTTINNWNYGVAFAVNGTGNILNLYGWGEVVTLQAGTNTINSSQATVNAGNGSVINLTTMDGASGGRTDVNVVNGTINLAANSHADIFGNGNAVHLAGGDASGIWGDNETVTATGNNSLWGSGDNLTFNMSGSAFTYSGSNVSATLNGNNNTITANGAGEHLTFNGANNTAYVKAGGQQFTINGTNNLIQGDNATVTLSGTGGSALVHGLNNIVTAGALSHLDIDGTATVTASGSTISTSGWGNNSGNIAITGDGDIINLDGYGDTVSIEGTNETISGHWTTVNLTQADASSTIDGVGLTVNAATGDNISISSNITSGDELTNLNISNGLVDVTSGQVRINGNNDTVTVEAGASAYITSTDTGITLISDGGSVELESQVSGTLTNTQIGSYLNNVAFTVNGDGNTANLYGWYDTITIHGDNNTISGSHSTITINEANDILTVTGDDNTINAAANSVVTVATLSGPFDHSDFINISSGTVNSGADTSFWVTGDSNIVNIGTGSCLALTGNLNTITSTTAVIAYIIGSNYSTTANVTNSSLYLQSSSETVTVTGDGNTITANSNNNVINASGNGGIVNASWNTINLTSNSSYTFTGDDNTINAAANSVVTVATLSGPFDHSDFINISSGTVNSGADTSFWVTGDSNIVNIGAGSCLALTGNLNTITSTTAVIAYIIGSNYSTTANVTNSSLYLQSSSETVTVAGDGNTITANSNNNVINVSGNGSTVNASWSTVNLTGSGAYTVDGIGLTVNASDGETVTIDCALTSWDQVDTLNLSNGTAITSGELLINGSNDVISVQTGAAVTGDDNTITLDNNAWLNISGSGNAVTSGMGDTIGIWGGINTITGSQATVNLNSSGTLTVTGDNDTINAADGSIVTVATLSGPEGDFDTVNLNSGTMHFAANSSADFIGSGNVVTIDDNAAIWIGGDNNTVSITGASALWTDGVNNTITASNSQIYLDESGQSLSVTGDGNTIEAAGGDTITVHGTDNIINASNSTIYKGNASTVTINGTGNTVVTLGVAPIILDLGDDGLELTPVGSSDLVTTASNGALTRLGWVGPTNGILVTDRNGDGQYGDVQDISFTQDRVGAQTDLEGLAGWDTNGDGVISAMDAGWSKLSVWVDTNGDGVSQDGEVRSLDQVGLSSISLKRDLTGDDGTLTTDSYASATSSFTRSDGTTGTSYDVTLGQQVLATSGWQESLGVTWTQLTNYGQIGTLNSAYAARLGTSDATDINYTGLAGLDPVTAAIWGDFIDPVKNAARKAALASGQIGDTSWMQQNGVTVDDPNRGAKVATQRLQVLDLDLQGAGPNVTELGAHDVSIDVNQTGKPMNTAWVGNADGLLVVDAVGDGDVDAATEATFQNWIPYARTSLQGLSAFDTSQDGKIDAEDRVFSALRIWTDSDGDGVSRAGELKTLTEIGVQSISLNAATETVDTKALSESQILASATVTMLDGSIRTLYDIALGVDDPDASSPSGSETHSSNVTSAPASQQLASVIDMTAAPVAIDGMAQSLTGALEASGGSISQGHGSDGPSGTVLSPDEGEADASAEGWWQSAGDSLSDAINAFNAPGETNESNVQVPMASANDAAMVQRHLLLRQAIAGFTADSAAPAIFARQGGLDTQATLAAATRSTAAQVSNAVTKAA